MILADIRDENLVRTQVTTQTLEQYIQNLFYQQIKEKNIKLICHNDIDIIMVNEELIHILLGNLVENAIRACLDYGEIIITVKQKQCPYIIVEDTGIGMESEDLKRIVEPFYRVDKARSRKSGGVGLGVTLCQKIVEAHGGTIHYQSEIGKGTKVTVSL